jgi:lipopolysaccharide/colanic/teichoic acid biosynthesis glycosyltransferase
MSPSSLFTTRSRKLRHKSAEAGRDAMKPKNASPAPAVKWQPDVLRRTLPIQKKQRVIKPEEWQIAPAGNRSFLYLTTKRTIDILGAAALLILLSPLLLTVLMILFVTTKGHPIYWHERLGILGRPFRLYKFRTMVMDAEKLQALVKNQHTGPIFKNNADPRVTRLGKLLRRTSIDELPQLFNILLGDMSLVGPRPPLEKEVAEYEPWQRKRLSVKPGLTCLWQVSGRSEIGFHRWMLMDLWYVRHQSLLTDLGLLLRTPWAVMNRNGAY